MQMNQLFLLTILCLSTFAAFAQNEDKIVTQVTSLPMHLT